MFCNKCGKNIDSRNICPFCEDGKQSEYLFVSPAKKWPTTEEIPSGNKSFLVAGLLQIFTGAFGLGRFYLKSYKIALFQLLSTVLTLGAGGFIWGFVDVILILSGAVKKDGNGEKLKI